MRLNKTLLVASVALFVCIEASSVKSQLSSTTRVTPDQDHGKLRRSDANEERIFNLLGVQEISHFVADFYSASVRNFRLLDLYLAEQSVPSAFKFLDLDLAGYDLFRKPELDLWYDFAHIRSETPTETIVRVLVDHLGYPTLTKMIITARKAAETKALATELGDALFQIWSSRLSPRRLFDQLDLKAESDGLFRDPVFRKWCQYVQQKEADYAYEVIAMVLLDRSDYLSLTTKILAARKLEDTKDMAAQIYAGLLKEWVLRKVLFGKLLKEKLTIDLTDDNLLHNSVFDVWFDYVKASKAQSFQENAVKTLLDAWQKSHIFNKLQTLTKGDDTEEVVTFLKEGQMWLWYKHQVSDVDVLNDFNPTSHNLFRDPMFDDWYKYMNFCYELPDIIAVRTLLRRSGDRSVTKMLIDAANDDHTRDIALRFQSELINIWIEDKVPIAVLFQRLKLKPISDKIFDDTVFHAWCNYANSMINGPNVVVAKDLSTRLDDLSLTKMLISLANDYRTRDIALDLQSKLIETWRRDQVPIAELFERLALNPASDDLQHNPLFYMWKKYVKRLENDPHSVVKKAAADLPQ